VAITGTWLTMTGQDEPRRLQARVVSPDYFEVIGVASATGRTFRPEEGPPGNERVLPISHRFWLERLGLDPEVLGSTLTLDGYPYRIIGTLPPDSWFDRSSADVWMPLAITRGNTIRGFRYLSVYGRLRPGAARAGAQAEMDAIAARLALEYREKNKGSGVIIDAMADRVVGHKLRHSLYVLFAAAGAISRDPPEFPRPDRTATHPVCGYGTWDNGSYDTIGAPSAGVRAIRVLLRRKQPLLRLTPAVIGAQPFPQIRRERKDP
jgi:hypothetical protein